MGPMYPLHKLMVKGSFSSVFQKSLFSALPHSKGGNNPVQSSWSKRSKSTTTLNLNHSFNSDEPERTSLHYLNFNDGKECYKTKTTLGLVHSLMVYKLCSFRPLVDNADKLLNFGRKVFGDKLITAVIRPTFYNYFCAGRNTAEVQVSVDKLRKYGVGAILDYAAEGDVTEDSHSASIDVNNEKVLDLAVQTFLKCLQTTAETSTNGFAAIKITALADAAVLDRGNMAVDTIRYLYIQFLKDLGRKNATMDNSVITFAEFNTCMGKYFNKLSVQEIEQVWNIATQRDARAGIQEYISTGKIEFKTTKDTAESITMNFHDWYHGLSLPQMLHLSTFVSAEYKLVKPTSKPYVYTASYLNFTKTNFNHVNDDDDTALPIGVFSVNQTELDAVYRVYSRCNVILQTAHQLQVRTLIDAEHCYFQRFIDGVTLDFQRVYNVFPKQVRDQAGINSPDAKADNSVLYPVVWNTYQNYLTDSTSRLLRDLDTANKEGFFWGAKLVRGAYMVLERDLASKNHFISPIYDNIEQTHNTYNSNICHVIDTLQQSSVQVNGTTVHLLEVMAASHNQSTVEVVTDKIVDIIKNKNGNTGNPTPQQLRKAGVYFGQLLGMADHLTFTLGTNDFSPYKYVPYGEVMEVLPYLIRRAQENSNMLGGVGHERKMLWQELTRRMKSSFL